MTLARSDRQSAKMSDRFVKTAKNTPRNRHADCFLAGTTLFLEAAMNLTRRSPRESAVGGGLSTISDRIQRMLNDTLGSVDWQSGDNAAASWIPPVDVFEEADNIRITAEIPGVKRED